MTIDGEMVKLGCYLLGGGLLAWVLFGMAYDWLLKQPVPKRKDKHDGWMG